jgi:excisionase family DNA binding protein
MTMPENRDIDMLLKQNVYRPEEAASLLEIDVDVIRNAAFKGTLPATIIGHDIVEIRRNDLLEWLKLEN